MLDDDEPDFHIELGKFDSFDDELDWERIILFIIIFIIAWSLF